MKTRHAILPTAALAAAALVAAPSLAQKDKGTFRGALLEPIKAIDRHYDPQTQTTFMSDAIQDTLIHYDAREGIYRPLLAKAWRRINPTTLEFDLEEGVVWHDGERFDADDVVYTVRWHLDPKTQIRFRGRYTWMKDAVKLGPYKVRIVGKKPYAIDLVSLAFLTPIYPEHYHSKFNVKSDYGRAPIGTGAYRVVSLDTHSGAVLERFHKRSIGEGYRNGTNVERYQFRTIPDRQSQIAELLTGGVDYVKDLPPDQVEEIIKDERFTKTVNHNLTYIYFLLDANNRSGLKPLTDKRVRKAIYMAIDRKKIAAEIIGNGSRVWDAVCDPRQFGCAVDNKPPPFDPAGAKKLLAEAGYADGFDLTINSISRTVHVAEALLGYLRDVGIRATVRGMTFPVYRKLQGEGNQQALVHTWSSGGIPDASAPMSLFYVKGMRNYHGDPRMIELKDLALAELDADKRKAYYREAFTRVNDNYQNIVIGTLPSVITHNKNVEIRTGSIDAYGVSLQDMWWKE